MQALLDALVMGVECIGEDVDVHAFVGARQLHGGNQGDAGGVGVRLDLEIRGQVVVVADGEDLDAVCLRHVDHFARCACAVGVMCMRVKIGDAPQTVAASGGASSSSTDWHRAQRPPSSRTSSRYCQQRPHFLPRAEVIVTPMRPSPSISKESSAPPPSDLQFTCDTMNSLARSTLS